MSIEQAISERRPRRQIPHWRRRKVIAPQHEFAFVPDTFALIGEKLQAPEPEPVQPEKAAELFAEMRWILANGEKANRA